MALFGVCLPERGDDTAENQRGTDQPQCCVKSATGWRWRGVRHASFRGLVSAVTATGATSSRVAHTKPQASHDQYWTFGSTSLTRSGRTFSDDWQVGHDRTGEPRASPASCADMETPYLCRWVHLTSTVVMQSRCHRATILSCARRFRRPTSRHTASGTLAFAVVQFAGAP